jgi:hypothetical protein
MLVATASPARTALKNSQLTRRPPGESMLISGTGHWHSAGRSGAWCNLLTWSLFPAKENLMGKQYNKLLKRRRRLNYLKRKHKTAKA